MRHVAKKKQCSVDDCTNTVKQEEVATGMGQRRNDSVLKDAQIKVGLGLEDITEDMGNGRRSRSIYAALKDAQTLPNGRSVLEAWAWGNVEV